MLSFGLVYLPGAYAGTDELVAVAEEAAAVGVPIVPHVRNEGAGLLEAVAEMVDVARRSGAPLHISHLKALADERLVEPLLALLEERVARSRRHLRPVPVRRRQHTARERPPRLGAGGRRGGHAADDLGSCVAAEDRAGRLGRPARLGEPARDARPRADRDRERGGAQRGGGRADAGRARRRARHRRRRRCARPHARVRPRRDDGAPLRLRRRSPRDRAPPAPARRLGRHLRRRARTRASTRRHRASSGASRSGTG